MSLADWSVVRWLVGGADHAGEGGGHRVQYHFFQHLRFLHRQQMERWEREEGVVFQAGLVFEGFYSLFGVWELLWVFLEF